MVRIRTQATADSTVQGPLYLDLAATSLAVGLVLHASRTAWSRPSTTTATHKRTRDRRTHSRLWGILGVHCMLGLRRQTASARGLCR